MQLAFAQPEVVQVTFSTFQKCSRCCRVLERSPLEPRPQGEPPGHSRGQSHRTTSQVGEPLWTFQLSWPIASSNKQDRRLWAESAYRTTRETFLFKKDKAVLHRAGAEGWVFLSQIMLNSPFPLEPGPGCARVPSFSALPAANSIETDSRTPFPRLGQAGSRHGG